MLPVSQGFPSLFLSVCLPDGLGTASPGAIWSQVEISVGIISACLPVYRPLFSKKSKRKPGHSVYSGNTADTWRNTPQALRGDSMPSQPTQRSQLQEDVEMRPFVELTEHEASH